MHPYFFSIKSEPVESNPQRDTLGGAMAHIWVFDASLDSARAKALRILESYGWRALKIDIGALMLESQIPCPDNDEYRNYRQAELYGTSCELLAWPKKPRESDKTIYIEPLKKLRGKD